MMKGRSLQFFMEDQELQKQWIHQLKSSCILIDLEEEFNINKLPIGSGNFAQVHEGFRHSDPDKKWYALKAMKKDKIRDCKRNIQNVKLEVDIMRVLDHPYVIKMYEVYESNKYVTLVLDYMDGGELFQRLQAKQTYNERTAM